MVTQTSKIIGLCVRYWDGFDNHGEGCKCAVQAGTYSSVIRCIIILTALKWWKANILLSTLGH